MGRSLSREFKYMDVLQILGNWWLLYVVLGLVFVLQGFAIVKGYLVKVEYSQPKRLLWAILISAIFASSYLVTDNIFSLIMSVLIGIFLYYKKQYYALRIKKN